MTDHGFEIIVLRAANGASASFAPGFGARGTSLILPARGGGLREVLYCRPDFWTRERDNGGLPFLFPVCGRHIVDGELFKYRLDGAVLDMPMHGFSLRKPWTVKKREPDRLVMSLTDDEATRTLYPFRFEVTLDYRIFIDHLECRQTFVNRGDRSMPFFAGFHPYFAVDSLDAGGWSLGGGFESVGHYHESYTAIARWDPAPASIDAVAAAKIQNVIRLDPLKPIRLGDATGVRVELLPNHPGDSALFPYLQTYRSNQDPFICLEPWMATPNGLNEPERITHLAPGEVRGAVFSIGATASL